MAAVTKTDDSTAKPKYRYRVKNWADYDRALVNRGNLTIWFDEASIAQNWTPPRPSVEASRGFTRMSPFRPA